MCKLWLLTVSLFGLTVVVASNDCNSRPCQALNKEDEHDTGVSSIASLNCSFEVDLCCFVQGCADFGIGNWTTQNGYARVQEYSTSCGGVVYSTLESPWVNMTTPSCVEFTYHRGKPYQLEVFLAFPNGTQPSLKYASNGISEDQNHTARFDVESLTGKIQFRAKGGGAEWRVAPPKMYYVRILDGRCKTDASSVQLVVSDPTSCGLATTTPPTTEHTASGAITHLSSSSMRASISSQPPATAGRSTFSSSSQQAPTSTGVVQSSSQQSSTGSSADMSTGSLVAIIVSAIVVIVVVVVFIVLLLRRRRRKQANQKPRGSGNEGARQHAVYENQGFHGPPVGTLVEDSSVVNAREMSDLRDLARASDASNEYLTPVNVYDGLTNRNIEENPYDALANQNSTYEGLSPNRNETRLYDSLVASGGQSEDYEIPDTTGSNKEGVAEVNRDSDEYYNQASSKVSEYQNG